MKVLPGAIERNCNLVFTDFHVFTADFLLAFLHL
jgi:hypothetical protein